jgi:aspartyl-tRNA(Asn)/glutamyl-tRNA(Gln) amidotransferase subunit A
MQADPEMAASIDAAAAKLKELGADVREVETASLDEYAAVNRIILSSEAFAIHEQWMKERPQDYGALGRERLASGAFIRAADYVNALRRRRQLTAAFHALFADVDVMLTASSMDPACRIDDARMVDHTYARQARSPFNVTGSPALSLPSGFSKDGLPLGIQLIGQPFSEALLYRVAHAYEEASPWKDRHPTLV